jgi:hypothetical protein
MGARSYAAGDSAEKVATIAGDPAKCTWGESLLGETRTEKLAANGMDAPGDNGSGAGRLRIDLEVLGVMKALGDLMDVLRMDLEAMIIDHKVREKS